jgi:hypothetical protein
MIPQLARESIAAVMDVARNHSRNPTILKPLFHLLTMMAFDVNTLELIREENAISFVIDTLCNMYKFPAIVMQTITVLETIGTASTGHARVVADEGGKTAIKGMFCGGFVVLVCVCVWVVVMVWWRSRF